MAAGPDRTALLGALVALRSLEREQSQALARETRAVLTPLFRQQVAAALAAAPGGSTAQDRAVYGAGSARMTAGGKGTLVVATAGRARSGGLSPATDWPLVEFGSGKAHGQRGQLPRHTPGGRVAFAAVSAWAPAAAGVWLGVLAGGLRDALGGQ